jgi:hypothetical protein
VKSIKAAIVAPFAAWLEGVNLIKQGIFNHGIRIIYGLLFAIAAAEIVIVVYILVTTVPLVLVMGVGLFVAIPFATLLAVKAARAVMRNWNVNAEKNKAT